MDTALGLVALLGIYLLPTTIALLRKHRNTLSIAIINTTLGWTLIGWVVALVMAVWQKDDPKPLYNTRTGERIR